MGLSGNREMAYLFRGNWARVYLFPGNRKQLIYFEGISKGAFYFVGEMGKSLKVYYSGKKNDWEKGHAPI